MRSASAPLVSRRGAVIITVIVIAVVLLAMPLREFLGQRAAIGAMSDELAQRRERVDGLQRELDRWEDPEYVRGQARSRLHYVLPGEVGYIVLEADANDNESLTNEPEAHVVQRPWFARLWRSVEAADS